MKKILIIPFTISTGGGSEKVLYTLIEELSKHYQIDLIERLECSTHSYQLPDNVRKLKSMSFTDKYLQIHNGNRFWGHIHRILLSLMIFIFPKWVYKYYIHSRHYDFEISFNYLYTSYLVAHSPNSSSKKIMWFHGSIYDLEWKNYHGIKRYIYKALFKMQKNALKKADHIVPISINTKKSIEKLFPFSHPKITMINNGYNFNHIEILSKEPVSIPKRKKYRLISIGRLDQNKNVMLQLEALSILKKNNSQIELIIIGEGNERNNLTNYINNNQLTEDVILTGFLPNPYPLLKTSDCLLVSSYSEGFPTVIVEALYLGIPVVTTPVGGTEELIQEGGNGYISDYSPKIYAKRINDILSNPIKKSTIHKGIADLTVEEWTKKIQTTLLK
ncbi:glycosyltransferase [Butyricimonas faecalis]|uniref:Glycosyltransferase n=1 Tax=Butyricimonas faecalis TaxID=2093856 RepID=A0A3S9VSI2_9BACT|nr:glycosyltransferase [Butyricimonas faecalis]AZS29468.1 glycosyltransferase [Butyricimonas faecalis]